MRNRAILTAALAPLLAMTLAARGPGDVLEPTSSFRGTDDLSPAAASAVMQAGVTQEMIAQGRQIFHGQGICFSCHGQEGKGTALGPTLADKEWLNLKTGDLEEIVAIIRTGVPKPVKFPAPMPANGGAALNDAQRRQVAAYVFSISR